MSGAFKKVNPVDLKAKGFQLECPGAYIRENLVPCCHHLDAVYPTEEAHHHCTKKLTPRTNIARGLDKSGVWSLAYLTLILEYSEFPWIDAMPLNNSINVAVIVT